MSTNLFPLIKLQIMDLLNINILRYSKNNKEKNSAIIYIVSIILAGIFFTFFSLIICIYLASIKIENVIPAYMLTSSSIIIFLFTIFKTNGVLFDYKDYDLLMSLPIKTTTLIFSRLFSMYIINLIFELLIILPSSLIYLLNTNNDISYLLMMFVFIFTIPLIPMTFATAFGAIVTIISCKFKYKNFLNTILSLSVIAIIIYFSFFSSSFNFNNFQQIGTSFSKNLYKIYPISKIFSEAICNIDTESFIIFITLSISWFYLFIKLLNIKYCRINTSLSTIQSVNKFNLKNIKVSSPFWTLYKKEFIKYFSSYLYVLNTAFGLLALIVIAFFIAFMKINLPETFLNSELFITLLYGLPYFISLVFVLSCTTSSSLSLEGNNLWIIKSLPIKNRLIINSKIAVNLTLLLTTTIICSFILCFKLDFTTFQRLMLFIVPTIYSFFISTLGMYMNIKFPNYNWTSEITVIKQGAAIVLTLLIGMFSIFVPLAVLFFAPIKIASYVIIISSIIVIALTILIYSRMLNIKCKI